VYRSLLSRLREESSPTPFVVMDSYMTNHSVRNWKILCWNVRGINSTKKSGMPSEAKLLKSIATLFACRKLK
jgi:hypothetical protein